MTVSKNASEREPEYDCPYCLDTFKTKEEMDDHVDSCPQHPEKTGSDDSALIGKPRIGKDDEMRNGSEDLDLEDEERKADLEKLKRLRAKAASGNPKVAQALENIKARQSRAKKQGGKETTSNAKEFDAGPFRVIHATVPAIPGIIAREWENGFAYMHSVLSRSGEFIMFFKKVTKESSSGKKK